MALIIDSQNLVDYWDLIYWKKQAFLSFNKKIPYLAFLEIIESYLIYEEKYPQLISILTKIIFKGQLVGIQADSFLFFTIFLLLKFRFFF